MVETVTETKTSTDVVTEEVTIERTKPTVVEEEVELARCPVCEQLYEVVIEVTLAYPPAEEPDEAIYSVICEHCAADVFGFDEEDFRFVPANVLPDEWGKGETIREVRYHGILANGIAGAIGMLVITLGLYIFSLSEGVAVILGVITALIALILFAPAITPEELKELHDLAEQRIRK